MQNEHLWKPTLIKSQGQAFVVNESGIYGGSLHMVQQQMLHYIPLFKQFLCGELLDVGCGRVPYFELCRDRVSAHYCIDHADLTAGPAFIDQSIDLNKKWELDRTFQSVLCSDVLAHVQNPFQLFECLAQHTAPGGHLVLTSPFHYWMSHPAHEYFHPTGSALRMLCEQNGFEIVLLQSYGGFKDIQLDILNKRWNHGWSYRFFKLFKKLFINPPAESQKNSEKDVNWALGYILVARRKHE
jgi:Methyltransferase domain